MFFFFLFPLIFVSFLPTNTTIEPILHQPRRHRRPPPRRNPALGHQSPPTKTRNPDPRPLRRNPIKHKRRNQPRSLQPRRPEPGHDGRHGRCRNCLWWRYRLRRPRLHHPLRRRCRRRCCHQCLGRCCRCRWNHSLWRHPVRKKWQLVIGHSSTCNNITKIGEAPILGTSNIRIGHLLDMTFLSSTTAEKRIKQIKMQRVPSMEYRR